MAGVVDKHSHGTSARLVINAHDEQSGINGPACVGAVPSQSLVFPLPKPNFHRAHKSAGRGNSTSQIASHYVYVLPIPVTMPGHKSYWRGCMVMGATDHDVPRRDACLGRSQAPNIVHESGIEADEVAGDDRHTRLAIIKNKGLGTEIVVKDEGLTSGPISCQVHPHRRRHTYPGNSSS